jgi:hypothetical protein
MYGAWVVAPSEFVSDVIIGITDGSVSTASGTYHALPGEPVKFQSGQIVIVRLQKTLDPGTNNFTCQRGAPLLVSRGTGGAVTGDPWIPNSPSEYVPIQLIAFESYSLEDFTDMPLVYAFRSAEHVPSST